MRRSSFSSGQRDPVCCPHTLGVEDLDAIWCYFVISNKSRSVISVYTRYRILARAAHTLRCLVLRERT